jgi:hypothetical protein
MKKGAHKKGEKPYLVHCLCIDMIGSTKAGFKLLTYQFDTFNRAFIEQIAPHLKELQLNNSLLKFTGDGWLLMTDKEDSVPALCCLATIMAKKFKSEMSIKTGIKEEKIPLLRLAICSGRDIRIELPNGNIDWVGDSARRSVRATQHCLPNEILIDEPVRCCIFRDFETKGVRLKARQKKGIGRKIEENFPVYTLGKLKTKEVSAETTPEYFVYMLGVIGEEVEAKKVAKAALGHLKTETRKRSEGEKEQILKSWNRLISSVMDYSTASKIVDGMRKAGLKPNVFTYNIFINKSPDYEKAVGLLNEMHKEGIQPDVVTYNTLINKSPDYEKAAGLLNEMHKEGIQPDVVTYNTLIDKSPDYEKAVGLLNEMCKEDIQPSVVTYNTLIDKSPDYEKSVGLINEMRKEGLQPNVFTYTTLIDKSPDYNKAVELMNEMRKEGIQLDLFAYTTLINKSPDYYKAVELMNEMCNKGIQLDLFAYTALINKSPDYEKAVELMKKMHKEGIQPSVVIYNTLINKSPDYEKAVGLMKEMRKEGIQSNIVTYNTLINKSPDYEKAVGLMNEMRKEGIRPDISAYNTLFSKDLSSIVPDEIIRVYGDGKCAGEEPIQAAIASYRKHRMIEQALYLAERYPHLQAAQKVLRQVGKK